MIIQLLFYGKNKTMNEKLKTNNNRHSYNDSEHYYASYKYYMTYILVGRGESTVALDIKGDWQSLTIRLAVMEALRGSLGHINRFHQDTPCANGIFRGAGDINLRAAA